MTPSGWSPLLFATNEQERLDRGKDAERALLREILEETEWEMAAIRSRLVDTRACEFPVAVTFLEPAQMGLPRIARIERMKAENSRSFIRSLVMFSYS